MPKKIRRLALKMALSDKIASGKLIVMDSFNEGKKSKRFLSAMKTAKLTKRFIFRSKKR